LVQVVWVTALSLLAAGATAQVLTARQVDHEQIARQLARIALIDLRFQLDPGPSDARLAGDLLAIAHELDEDEPILLRYLIEARRSSGDEEGVIDATRLLLRLDPGDQVSQLRLLSWAIAKRQTAEDRLAAFAFWLDGPGAQELQRVPAVRSRLALEAALLHRELGDDAGFVRRLSQAATLDSTNKEAAALAAAVFSQRSDDPVGRLELLVNLLLSDPLDPNLHLAMSEELAAGGVYDQSRRFHDLGLRLLAAAGADIDTPQVVTQSSALVWHTLGPARLLAIFEGELRRQRDQASETRRRLTEAGRTLDGTYDPKDIRLSFERERFRLFAALALDDRVSAERSVIELEATIAPVLERIRDQINALDPADTRSREQLAVQALQIGIEALTGRLIANVQPSEAAANLQSIRQVYGQGADEALGLLDALVALRLQSPEAALPMLEPLAGSSALGDLVLGMTYEELGRNEEALRHFEWAAAQAPLTAPGVLARSRAELVRGGAAPLDATTEALRAVAEAVPRWVDSAALAPNQMARLSVSTPSPTAPAYAPARVSIEIRNLLPKPVGVGGARPIDTRFALSPQLEVGATRLSGLLNPEVVDVHRLLRLEPSSTATATVWPDAGMMGWLTEVKAGHRVGARWNVLQNPTTGVGTPYRAGPLAQTAESPLFVHGPDADVRLSADELVRSVQVADEPRLLSLLLTLRAALLDPDRPGGPLGSDQAQAIAGAMAQRLGSLSAELRLATAVIMPPASMRKDMQPLDQALLAETEPRVLRVALLTRAYSPDTPALARAAASPDQGLSMFARMLSARLAAGVAAGQPRGFAFMGPPTSHLPPPLPDAVTGGR
jgi:tetratricopeptide (TPR) repeat protein